jgi:hypothetical protein
VFLSGGGPSIQSLDGTTTFVGGRFAFWHLSVRGVVVRLGDAVTAALLVPVFTRCTKTRKALTKLWLIG